LLLCKSRQQWCLQGTFAEACVASKDEGHRFEAVRDIKTDYGHEEIACNIGKAMKIIL